MQEDPIWDDNLYTYCSNNPLSYYDPFGLSTIVFDRSDNKIYIFPGNEGTYGPPQIFSASNNPTNPKGDPLSPNSHGPAPNGTFKMGTFIETNKDINSDFGTGFIPININGKRTGIGLHAGRANKGGYLHKTYGCIRTTEEALDVLRCDPPTKITIQP